MHDLEFGRPQRRKRSWRTSKQSTRRETTASTTSISFVYRKLVPETVPAGVQNPKGEGCRPRGWVVSELGVKFAQQKRN